MSAEDIVQGTETAFGRDISKAGYAERESNRRRASAAGSCAYDDIDSAQIFGVASDWIYKREECNSLGAGLRGKETQFCWATFMGKRLLCINRWAGREGNTRVDSEAG